ncbi:MAG: GUN4 domain-containing protein, partial [Bacteroidota bacterium]
REASNDHFGFSVQKEIWEECGSPTSYNDDWEQFGDRVGWRKNGQK